MGTGIRPRAAVVAAVAAVAVVFVPHTPSAASDGVHIGTYADRIRLEAPSGTTIEIQRPDGGRTHRLAEDVEFIHTGAGLVLVNDVSMRTYVEGIAEMPVGWPIEALKAQAVAARTYAWRAIEAGTYTHYDICATVACQVFRGRDVVSVPGGERWAQAVAETDGEALLHDGQPILARYFSTSGGHTRSNEEVFPSSGPRPYLRGVPDPEDVVSPLHTWQVTFSRDEMNAILAEGQRLQAAVPLARVDILPAGGEHPDRVRVVNTSGGSVIMNASTFRGHVARVAPDLFPERFPAQYAGSDRRMPETLPSSRFEITVTDREVVVDGRGYGHGVGMSQYGAMGKADVGMTYDGILAAYYQGLRPTAAPVPGRVRVGLEDGAHGYTVRADGPVRILAGGRLVTERGLGTWSVERAEQGIGLTAPAGFGAALVVAPSEVALEALTTLHRVEVATTVNKPTELWLVVTDADGVEIERRDLGVVDAGPQVAIWSSGDLGPGAYEVALRAADETGAEEGTPVGVRVRAVEPSAGRPTSLLGPTPGQDDGLLALLVAGILGAMIGGALAGRIEVAR